MEPPPNTERPSATGDVPTIAAQPELRPTSQRSMSEGVRAAGSSTSANRGMNPAARFEDQLAIELEKRLQRIEARERGEVLEGEEGDTCMGDRHRFTNGKASAGTRSRRRPKYGVGPQLLMDQGGNFAGNNRTARTTMVNFVAEIMLNSDLPPLEALEILQNTKETCAQAGVSFSEVLAQDLVVPNHGEFSLSGGAGVKPVPGVPPVIWALSRMAYGVGYETLEATGELELLTFLMANSLSLHGRLELMLQRGCMLRADNTLFQNLRQVISSDLEYEVGVEEEQDGGGFHALVTISDFTEATQPPAPRPWLAGEIRYAKRSAPNPQKKLVTLEWIANARAWDLQLGPEEAWLRLRDGPPANVIEAHIEIIGQHRRARDSGIDFGDGHRFDLGSASGLSNSPKLSFPTRQLYPLSVSGPHTLGLPAPCFPRNEWPETTFADFVLEDSEELMIAVTVLLGPLLERVDGAEIDDEWERVSGSGESGGSRDALSTEWLLASWSGRDEVTH